MTVTVTSFAAGERAARLAGMPYLIGNNVLERYGALPQWRVSGSWSSGSNITDNTSYPVWSAWDRSGEAVTRPTAAAQNQTEVSFIMDLTPGGTGLDEIDTFVVIGHNFHSWGSNTDVYVDIADSLSDASFSGTLYGALWHMSSWPDGRRLISQEVGILGALSRFSNVRFVRLRIVRTSGDFGTTVPHFSELWLGRRRQLSYMPDIPFDNRAGRSESVDHIADGGQLTRYFKFTKQAMFGMTLRSGGNDRNGLNQNTELQKWWWNESQGGKASLLVLNPKTDADAEPYIVAPQAEFDLPSLGPFERATTLNFSEIPPFYRSEVPI